MAEDTNDGYTGQIQLANILFDSHYIYQKLELDANF